MYRWLKQVSIIARNTFTVFVGDPMIFIVNLFIILITLLITCLPGFTFGEQLRLLRDEILALTFICCSLAATIGAANNVSDDIRRGMIPILMSRPVSSSAFIWGKWLGIVFGILLLLASSAIAFLWASRLISTEDHLETLGLSVYLITIAITLTLMTIKHFLFRGSFVFQANIAVTFAFTAIFLLLNCWGYNGATEGAYGDLVNWATLKAHLFLFFALMIFSAIQVLLAVSYDQAILMAAAVVIFFMGLFMDYLTSFLPGPAIRDLLQTALPNWQAYWLTDIIAESKPVSLKYTLSCCCQAVGQAILFLTLASYLFQKKEYHGGF